LTGFVAWRSFEWRELVDPDGPATPRQLARLNRAGALELVAPGRATPITKGEAAAAINDGDDEGPTT
jgi:hypothetical protein